MNEAELLLTDILDCSRTDLYIQKRQRVGVDAGRRMAAVLQRRFKGEPFQYIVGTTEFMGLSLRVNEQVLIPRPETELLVEKTVSLCRGQSRKRILDMGTGSGCIAITLAKLMPDAQVMATDISTSALCVARDNALRHGVSIGFMRADMFPAQSEKLFSCIVSNPPYIPSDDIDTLQLEVQREPRIALDGGPDGLDFYRNIVARAPAYLEKGGYVVMEIGCGQIHAIENLLRDSKYFEIREVQNDYAGIERVIVAQLI